MRSAELPSLPGLLIRAMATLGRRSLPGQSGSGLAGRFQVDGIDRAHVARYRAFFDSPGQDVPLGYFYLLAQRAQLALMLDERFPHSIPGLIHTCNALRLQRQPRLDSPLELRVSVLPCPAGGDGQRIAFAVDIRQEGREVATCGSEYKRPTKRRSRPMVPDEWPAAVATIEWAVDKAGIRRYALLSGDCNPIHLSSLLARAFGLKQVIAHGMYSVGRAVACIERRTARPVVAITADFRRPVALPARLTFGFGTVDASRGAYGVLLGDEPVFALQGMWETGEMAAA